MGEKTKENFQFTILLHLPRWPAFDGGLRESFFCAWSIWVIREAAEVSDFTWTALSGDPYFSGFYAVMSESRG
jgi:hypothetical protein